MVRLGRVAKVKLYLFSLQLLKSPGSTVLFSSAIVICCENWPFRIDASSCGSVSNVKKFKIAKTSEALYGFWYYINAQVYSA